jgi:hypothetical protein
MKKISRIILLGFLILSILGPEVISQQQKLINNESYLGDYDMVVISPNVFSDELQQFIDYKNTVGITTILKPTEEIYQEYTGRDKAEQIKYCIKDMIETYQIEYVLLVGGRIGQSFQWYIPPRYSHVDDGFMHKEFLSDLYYSDIYNEQKDFEDWDSNGNNVFSEWYVNEPETRDIIDLKPDVALGRLACRNEQEVVTVVNKIIEYEQNTYGNDWFKKALFIGGDTNPGVGEPFPLEGEADCTYTAQLLTDFSCTSLFVSDGSLTGPDAVISSFNEGYGFVLFHGHGLQNGLFTHTVEGERLPIFHSDNISKLSNVNKYPIMVVGCCLTTEFDVGIFNFIQLLKNLKQHHHFQTWKYECVPDVLGWNLMKKSNGGTIGYVGDSSTSWGVSGDSNHDGIPDSVHDGLTTGLCAEFFRIIGDKEFETLGMVHKNTIRNVVESYNGLEPRIHYKNVQEFQLLGDPSLKIGGYENLNMLNIQ